MGEQFPHTSRPGFYGLTVEPELGEWLEAVATALVPGSAEYPSARDAQVLDFLEQRVGPGDLESLRAMAERWPVGDAAGPAVAAMEVEDPTSFVYLREFVYHAYYSSRRVLAAMSDRGYGYHGAPQPLGYRIEETMLVPTRGRGRYLATDEVTRVEK